MVSDEGILHWFERLRDEVAGLEPFDAHTHIGSNDPDGYRCSRQELVAALEHIDARAFVFPMHEPDGYAAANDMVIDEAAASDGRLVPFCRLDPGAGPLAEAERALARGARGIKLHPRAEGFTLDHPALRDVFALADERRVPVLCHAGRGIPALGRHAVEACARHPDMRLILAHAGISDLAWIWRYAPDHPNLFFDTSWWSPADLQALLALVPPGQVLMASDAPYATPAWGATMTMRHALQVGLDHEQVRGVLGLQAARLATGDDPLELGPPPGDARLPHDPLLDRVHGYLMSALGQMFNGVEPAETLALARLACEVGHDAKQADVCRSVLGLLDQRERYQPPPGGDGRSRRFAPGVHLIVVAAGLARTPDVPMPPPPPEADVDERFRGDPAG
ncbi:MAG TPA: amidohydrolase family protein [Thermoleophilaceae bacterium]|nr:amidohydrolase family protein [Thermoleophilaceae bacterium]